MDFWISEWISGFQIGFLDFTVDFWISQWISGFHSGFLDFTVDFWISVWISADGVRDFFRDGPLEVTGNNRCIIPWSLVTVDPSSSFMTSSGP